MTVRQSHALALKSQLILTMLFDKKSFLAFVFDLHKFPAQ